MRCLSIPTAAIAFIQLFSWQTTAQEIGLDTYTCGDFLSDTKDLSNGEKLLKSMMMISWATGYAAAFNQSNPRSDATALQLIAATLGSECQKNISLRVVKVISQQMKKASTSIQVNANSIAPVTPAGATRDDFKTFDNFDLPQADLSRLQNVDLNKCVAACDSNRDCRAFSYDKWNRWCFLKSKPTVLTFDPGSISAVRKSDENPPQSELTVRIDRRPAKALKGPRSRNMDAASQEVCEQGCNQDQSCLGYSFFRSTKKCMLFEEISTFSPDADATSGLKTQNAP